MFADITTNSTDTRKIFRSNSESCNIGDQRFPEVNLNKQLFDIKGTMKYWEQHVKKHTNSLTDTLAWGAHEMKHKYIENT